MYNKCTYVDISTAKNKEKQSELCSLQTVNLKYTAMSNLSSLGHVCDSPADA